MSEISEAKTDGVGKMRQNAAIPTDLGRFRTWADKECINWPPKLQIEAYEVILGRKSIEDFAVSYGRG